MFQVTLRQYVPEAHWTPGRKESQGSFAPGTIDGHCEKCILLLKERVMEIQELKGTSGEALLRFAIDSEQLSEQFLPAGG